jgi:uncharacterized protein with von Willebrand factor type A (vWA) domain
MLIETGALTTPCDEGLVANIVRFSHFLNRYDISVPLPSVLDAVRGLEFIGVSDPNRFRLLLKMNFVHRKADYDRFDGLFYRFWFDRSLFAGDRFSKTRTGAGEEAGFQDEPGENSSDFPTPKDPVNTALQKWVACYSPEALEKPGAPIPFDESQALYECIKTWLSPLRSRVSRRYRYTRHGKNMTLKNVLRKNMQFGGELILLDFKKKKVKKRKVIFLCDVSGSMNVYIMMLMQFIHALRRLDMQTEIFVFSTRLTRWTRSLDSGDDIASLARLPESVTDWGGGTRIGHCLRQFNKRYGERLLSNRSVVVIFSDGWDRGETDVLEAEMARIHNKAYWVIWLNPLMGSREYQPICRGMRTALPYVNDFMPMGDPKDILLLIKNLEKRVV